MNASVHATDTEVRDYVAGVRGALSDLPVEDVEEFTTGMEADLTERLAEPGEGTLRDRLGDPERYAAELRSAAGLPPRAVAVAPNPTGAERLSQWWGEVSGSVLGAMPWLRDLRPLWWAARGIALAVVPMAMVGGGFVILGIIGATISVAAGLMSRHGAFTGAWTGPVRIVLNVAAVMLLPFALAFALSSNGPVGGGYEEPYNYAPSGLARDGESVRNLYAYDESGRRIDNVRLFDQAGRPLRVLPEVVSSFADGDETSGAIDPNTGEVTADLGVFPLRWPGHEPWLGYDEWEPPLAITPLPGPVPTVDASPAPSVPQSPSASPSTSPSIAPSGAATPKPSSTPTSSPPSPGSGAAATPSPTPSASR